MKAIRTPEMKHTFRAEGCYDLPALVQERINNGAIDNQIVTAWQLSADELKYITENGGIIYVALMGSQPPMQVGIMIPKEDYTGQTMTFAAIAERLHNEFATSKVEQGQDGIYVIFTDCHFKLSQDEANEVSKLLQEIYDNEATH